MKIKITSKKGLKTNLSIFVDKQAIQKRLDERLLELKDQVNLKGFRPGKVPPSVIKSQFGKAIYGEVIDKLLKETSNKAIEENKIKVAGQPKIDLKSFGEGKDLNYTMELETLPEIKLRSLDKIKVIDYEVSVEKNIVEKRLTDIAKNQQNFEDKNSSDVSAKGDLIIFDYKATVDGKEFEGNTGKNVQIVLGKDLFIKGFDSQLTACKKNSNKIVSVKLPENFPKKEIANKESKFECKIINIKKPTETKINDEFAKKLGAKDLNDLKEIIKKQTISEYTNSLDNISKKKILEEIEKLHNIDLPQNLVEQETNLLSKNMQKEDAEKNRDNNTRIAKSRIKTGLILNEIGEKNNLKINEEEIRSEIQKHVKSMPGQEKIVMDYYQKNPAAVSSVRGVLYEEKIIKLIKTKINLNKKTITLKEADKILKEFSEKDSLKQQKNIKKKQEKSKNKKKNK